MDEVCHGDQPRLADGRPRQLGRDPVADPAGPRRRRSAPLDDGRARPTSPPGSAARADAAYQAVHAPGRGHDPHRRARGGRGGRARGRPASRRSRRCSSAAADAARDAVARTPDLLPVLRDAGVVDAGGKGFTLLLAAFLEVVDGRPIPEPEVVATPRRGRRAPRAATTSSSLRYEVMYLLDAPTTRRSPRSSDAWGAIGDSIVVVGGDGLWNCHVHTNDIGAAVEAGIDAGRPRKIRVTDLHRAGRRGALGARGRRASPTSTELADRAVVTTAVVAVGGRRRDPPPAHAASACSRSSPAASR